MFRLNVLITALIASLCAISVSAQQQTTCSKYNVRQEWRDMEPQQQDAYISAVKCLLSRPSRNAGNPQMPGVLTRYDDFVLTHIQMTPTAQFLPWHRLFVYAYEAALQNECGYQGAHPYWDWNLDVKGDFMSSPVFDAFGHNGVPAQLSRQFSISDISHLNQLVNATRSAAFTNDWSVTTSNGGGCVVDGAFANLQVTLGPWQSLANNPRCLTRDVLPAFAAQTAADSNLLAVLDAADFSGVMGNIDSPHEAGHGGIGGYSGDMANLFSSTVDPIFFMHHSNLDRLWWSWQLSHESHLYDMRGSTTIGSQVNDISLDYVLSIDAVNPYGQQYTIRDVMNSMDSLCVAYNTLYLNTAQMQSTGNQISVVASQYPVGVGGTPVGSASAAPSGLGGLPSSALPGNAGGLAGGFPGGAGQFSGAGGQFPGAGGQFPGAGGQFPGAGGQFPGGGGQFLGGGGQFPGGGGQFPGSSQFPGGGGLFPGGESQFFGGGFPGMGGIFGSLGGFGGGFFGMGGGFGRFFKRALSSSSESPKGIFRRQFGQSGQLGGLQAGAGPQAGAGSQGLFGSLISGLGSLIGRFGFGGSQPGAGGFGGQAGGFGASPSLGIGAQPGVGAGFGGQLPGAGAGSNFGGQLPGAGFGGAGSGGFPGAQSPSFGGNSGLGGLQNGAGFGETLPGGLGVNSGLNGGLNGGLGPQQRGGAGIGNGVAPGIGGTLPGGNPNAPGLGSVNAPGFSGNPQQQQQQRGSGNLGLGGSLPGTTPNRPAGAGLGAGQQQRQQ